MMSGGPAPRSTLASRLRITAFPPQALPARSSSTPGSAARPSRPRPEAPPPPRVPPRATFRRRPHRPRATRIPPALPSAPPATCRPTRYSSPTAVSSPLPLRSTSWAAATPPAAPSLRGTAPSRPGASCASPSSCCGILRPPLPPISRSAFASRAIATELQSLVAAPRTAASPAHRCPAAFIFHARPAIQVRAAPPAASCFPAPAGWAPPRRSTALRRVPAGRDTTGRQGPHTPARPHGPPAPQPRLAPPWGEGRPSFRRKTGISRG